MNKQVTAMYFSATRTTRKVVLDIAGRLSQYINDDVCITEVDFTLPQGRQRQVSFAEDDVVVVGVPVYGGRVPHILLPYLENVVGNGATAIAVVVYGNRGYDDALLELADILQGVCGFKVIAAGSFIGEHSFSSTLAQGRPDNKDMMVAWVFVDRIYAKITGTVKCMPFPIRGRRPYRQYYVPKSEKGKPVDIRRIKPKTNGNCNDCKVCVEVCPMGAIDYENVSELKGSCIKCGACIKMCPMKAKYFDDPDYLLHKLVLEADCASRREPEMFF